MWSRVVPTGPCVGTDLAKLMTIMLLFLCVYILCRLLAGWPGYLPKPVLVPGIGSGIGSGTTKTCRMNTAARTHGGGHEEADGEDVV